MSINRNVRTTDRSSTSSPAMKMSARPISVAAPARQSVAQSVKGPKPAGRTNSTQPMSRGKIVHAPNGAVGMTPPKNVATSTKKR